MAHLGHPLVGDPLYGAGARVSAGLADPNLASALRAFPRQALHAIGLGLFHPEDDRPMSWQVAMATDLSALCERLQQDLEWETA
jgi:23S rRNA pseudouridine1911/1915/1917 synthase